MRQAKVGLALLILGLVLVPTSSRSWGFFAHKSINKLAVFCLPTELMVFYKDHIEYISEHAVDPDKRRYAITEEAPRHFIDIDHYGESPFEVMPRRWDDAVEKFTEDTLIAYGIVPWHIQRMYYRLVDAMTRRDAAYVLKTSADLGHYLADAHVPLHTTENYNGQLTNQKGIHGFWESRLPELYSSDYDFFVGKAEYIQDPLKAAWEAVEASHSALDSVLSFERALTKSFPSDRKYAFEQRGNTTIKTYSRDFSLAYHQALDGMVERRMRASILSVASFWYSAWIDAGQPNLNIPLSPQVLDSLERERIALEKRIELNAIHGRDHE